ncbi:MAG: hypothetical protein R6W70_07415, partial [bacterium]
GIKIFPLAFTKRGGPRGRVLQLTASHLFFPNSLHLPLSQRGSAKRKVAEAAQSSDRVVHYTIL